MSQSRLRWSLVAAFYAILASGAAMASSVTIPDGFLSIQAGIDSGADTVLVRNGDYDETPEAYRSLTLKGIGEGRPRVRGLLITNPISLSLHRGFSDIEFTAPVTMNTWNFHARILDIAFDHCTLDSGLVHSYYEDPEDIEYLTLANCEIRGGCHAVSYVVTMQSDTLDDGGASWDLVNTIHATDCWFRGGTGTALDIRGTVVIDCEIAGNLLEGYSAGIYAPDDEDVARITSNVIRRMAGAGIYMAGLGNFTFASNVIEDCGSGIACRGDRVDIVDNRIALIRSDGI